MKDKKRAKLPRGLRWHSESRFIWFTWYDSQGRQHKKSTETSDPEKALLFKMRFLEQQETRKADGVESVDLTSESLASAAKLYFDWKLANNSPETVSRERRMFKNVLKFFGPQMPVNHLRFPQICSYLLPLNTARSRYEDTTESPAQTLMPPDDRSKSRRLRLPGEITRSYR